jgi:hypothetical protein
MKNASLKAVEMIINRSTGQYQLKINILPRVSIYIKRTVHLEGYNIRRKCGLLLQDSKILQMELITMETVVKAPSTLIQTIINLRLNC